MVFMFNITELHTHQCSEILRKLRAKLWGDIAKSNTKSSIYIKAEQVCVESWSKINCCYKATSTFGTKLLLAYILQTNGVQGSKYQNTCSQSYKSISTKVSYLSVSEIRKVLI